MKYVFDPPPNIPYPYESMVPHDEAKRILDMLRARAVAPQPPAADQKERDARHYFRELLHLSHRVRGEIVAGHHEDPSIFAAAIRTAREMGGMDAFRDLTADTVMEARGIFVLKMLGHLA